MKRSILILVLLGAWTLNAASCAEHRDTRTEIFNENTYLNKDFLTRANPNHVNAETGEQDDYGWYLGTMITAVSVPTGMSDYFPALQSNLGYVRFSFTKDTMEIVDAIVPGRYTEDGNLVDPQEAVDYTPNVVQAYDGSHVDIQLRRDLNGEVTNYIEEYRERDWETRQHFKVDLESGAFSDLSRVSWWDDWYASPAMTVVSRSLVPGSYHYVDTVARESNFEGEVDWERGDYIEWTVRVTYHIDLLYAAYYYNMLNWSANTDEQTMEIKYSMWRRPDAPEGREYVQRTIAEKDEYRRQFGIWDFTVQNYVDPNTGFIGAETSLERFNANMPLDYYLVDVPQEYIDHPELGNMFDSMAEYTNGVFEQAGVDARISFHDQNEGGIHREPGDIRYSFVWWHNNNFTDIPWLGYGPGWTDPRTGEVVNATLNFNNWQGLRWYTEISRELLEQVSDAFEEDGGSCTPGEIRPALDETVRSDLRNTSLFSRMESYMAAPAEEWVPEHDEEWYDLYHALLPTIRFRHPYYNWFVQSPRDAVLGNIRDRHQELMDADQEFWDIAASLDSEVSPTGFDDFTSPGAIEAGLDFIDRARSSMAAHAEIQMGRSLAAGLHGIDLIDGSMFLGTIANINQRCKADGTWQTFDEWDADVRWRIAHQVSIHELGHNLGQYHNFYGSVDRPHYQPCTGCVSQEYGYSSSIMDYGPHWVEAASDLGFYPYDIATLIYAYRYNSTEEVNAETDEDIIRVVHPEWHDPAIDPADGTPGPDGDKHMERAYLYGNDYHRPLSPLIEVFDLGYTPSEIVFNEIQYYDFMYQFRNFRSWRQYWETWNYPNSAFSNTFPLRRFLDLWALDWNEEDLENDLRLLGYEADQFEFQNIRDEFMREMGQANRMAINFYRSILTQSNAERSYATTYDSFFGDVTRIGIIYDKFYAMLSFLGFWPSDNYDWDFYAYLAYYELHWGDAQTYSDAQDTVVAMLGGAYDVYPWFLPTAVLVFAEDTHNINFGDQRVKEWIGFRAFDRAQDMIDYYGFDPRSECMRSDGIEVSCATAALGPENDGRQTFHDADGGEWVYLFLDDRNQHLCASADMSPLSFQLLWDYNESVNIDHADYVTTYTIKYYLDYYEYFN